MKNKKSDHRSRYTQMIVKEALLKLLGGKTLNKIGVSELCFTAGVSRGTFYNHFYDVPDVYESIENDFLEEVKNKLEDVKNHNIDNSFFKEIMLLIYKNAGLVRLIINNKSNSDFLKRLINFVKDKFVKQWSEGFKHLSIALIERIVNYTTNGSIGIISEWIYSDMREPLDDMAVTIAELNDLILHNYLNASL